MSIESLTTPIACLTVEQFIDILDQVGYQKKSEAKEAPPTIVPPVFLRGAKELAEFLHCSTSTVSRLRENGILDGCSIERGKLILYDRDKVLQAMSKKKPRKYEHWKRSS